MLIHLSELFNCEGRKKVYTVETALDSVDFDGETFQIEKAEPFDGTLRAVSGDGDSGGALCNADPGRLPGDSLF